MLIKNPMIDTTEHQREEFDTDLSFWSKAIGQIPHKYPALRIQNGGRVLDKRIGWRIKRRKMFRSLAFSKVIEACEPRQDLLRIVRGIPRDYDCTAGWYIKYNMGW